MHSTHYYLIQAISSLIVIVLIGVFLHWYISKEKKDVNPEIIIKCLCAAGFMLWLPLRLPRPGHLREWRHCSGDGKIHSAARFRERCLASAFLSVQGGAISSASDKRSDLPVLQTQDLISVSENSETCFIFKYGIYPSNLNRSYFSCLNKKSGLMYSPGRAGFR